MMKQLYLLGILCIIFAATSFAQTNAPSVYQEFDPGLMPVGIDVDSSIQLIISDYVLVKSLKTQIPAIARVEEVNPVRWNGKCFLAYTIRLKETPQKVYYHHILLYKGLQEAWYVSNQSITCGSDCQDCKTGCACSSSGGCPQISPVMRISNFPLAKTSMIIEK